MMAELVVAESPQEKQIKKMLVLNAPKIAKALPAGVSADHFIRVILNSVATSPKLQACTIESIWTAAIEAATYGWEVGGPVAQCYLVPYKNHATLIPGYRGLMELARRSGKIRNIAFAIVREGDQFDAPPDPLEPVLLHIPKPYGSRERPCTHVWCGFSFTSGARVYEVMSREDIDAHKEKFSPGWDRKDSAWETNWEAMALKTVIKKPIMDGRVPIASEYQRLAEREAAGPPAEISQIDQTPDPIDDPGEISKDEQWRLFANYAAQLIATCEGIDEVDIAVGRLLEQYRSEDHAAEVNILAEHRRKAIRNARGERSNEQGNQIERVLDPGP